jgi:C4-dicarboxylate-specific signal transduction histidine kinase
VRGFAQRLRRASAERGGLWLDELEMIEVATERMSCVIDNVRRLSRTEPARRTEIDPLDSLQTAHNLVQRQLLDHAIDTQWILEQPLSRLALANPVELEQVFLNLLLNARDALCQIPVSVSRTLQIDVRVTPTTISLGFEDNGP